MTVNIPTKAGFVATVQEWDALVNVAEYIAQRALKMEAERDAARAEVARLTAARMHLAELSRDFLNDRNSFQAGLALRDETIRILAAAALRQPAPATAWCNCGMGDGTMPELHSAWCDVQKPAPATAKE